ncbi:hypothetical protein X740_17385 [Mesorhizobium sp. LNHC221B00]|nr:hypothetical protein X740_17385 [Mesorhizobium sp. LNHC221B00]
MSGNSIDKPLPVGREEAHIVEASCMAAVSTSFFVKWILIPVEAAKPRLKTPSRLSTG